ncbi:hypothetical protein ABB37_09502 [Leptomonas pyrrhocoris]|uniref:Uncharacterized protein n=1 Tax=Leptomonas pyrrhocoris TaxID=157538 RepID=A0A0N0DR33_LEPPY|nr:hypothetical protein ABB37_09502 [Leptomonas pyrrhocoris]XP_015652322.1 hypothetical protein ABB37_09502 [Leptomonas pyrrhocoris]XP_015652323.1 hypothetical protein ABB37_09502 [Leptomonas pyrrhocoris]XP_015652324.1 hypothetical protein ABB37_09502 [Leptomonas pyrrhocoris]KPA73882.1 hypothetical protein ABB37_09502 [Leptomonas pyrrhocoris]KPA73883.1 hypothetical protein ABB37_09502 [Leptomonas pyrrhocoris]KPA73884.1 hypothetical protein ABB37_09502 [Leptomonas pyrrhocoris]KPA73885.1 hypot|eukprot:XP_015652321.1 hypothetical protein ABB37_09502 [Leptomonas pyrrhocoris]
MYSDTESLAFMEEDDVSPTPKRVPPADVPRPHVTGAPSPAPFKSTPAKPPLHHAVSSTPAAATKSAHLPRPGFVQVTSKFSRGKHDAASEMSDNESVNFVVESNSVSGTPKHGALTSADAATGAPATRGAFASRRLSRAGSVSSIQFHSEPGSRSTSPQPKPRVNRHGSTPVEKTLAGYSPLTNGKAQVTNDSISFVFDQSLGSDQLGAASPNPQSATARGRSAPTPVPLATTCGPVGGSSVMSNDSIAFQIEDSCNAIQPQQHQQQVVKSPSISPLQRRATTTPSTAACTTSDRPAAPPASAADTSMHELADTSSIAFEVAEDSPAVKASAPREATASPSRGALATPYYNSHVRRSQSAQSYRNSRPNSPSIQFETEHNSDNESLPDQSASRVGVSSLSAVHGGLPSCGPLPSHPSPPTLAMTKAQRSSPTTSHPEMGSDGGASSTQPTKKTVVTNHLKRRQQRQRQSGPPPSSSKSRVNTQHVADGERELSASTHPPLYQKSAVSTPLAAQAAGVATEAAADSDDTRRNPRRPSSLTDRHLLPKKRDPSAVLNLQRPQTRRSKESATSDSQGASPNAKLFTEAGSTGTTDSPPEPPHTGRHRRTSVEGRKSAPPSQKAAPPPRGVPSHSNSVEDYLENQEMENVYHRHGLTQHARHETRTDRVLYREVSPPSQCTDPGASAAAAQETEKWRRFNEQQCAELTQLRHRIALARRQDRTLLENSPLKGLGAASGSNSRRGGDPKPTALALASLPGWTKTGPGYSDMKRAPSAHASLVHDQRSMESARSGTHSLSPSATERSRKTSPQSRPLSARRQEKQQPPQPANARYMKQLSELVASSARQPHASSRLQPTAASLKDPSRSRRATARPTPTAVSSGASRHTLLHTTAAASVADMLGVLWPPRSAAASSKADRTLPYQDNTQPVDLYFVNGSRLTAAQVDRFMDLVRVQAEAEQAKNSSRDFLLNSTDVTLSPQSYRHFSPASALLRSRGNAHDHPLSLTARDDRAFSSSALTTRRRAPLSAKLSALLPKKAVRRSRVMREVFDVMDLKHQGSLVLDFLPSLSRLFEGELAAIEETRRSLLAGKATPVATLLVSAMESRQQYSSAWDGGRGAGDDTPNGSGGLSQVLAADGAGLTPAAQAELLALTHRLLLLSFAVNVVIPVASAGRIPLLDFPTLCMVLYAAVDNAEHEMDSPREQWREVVQQYFALLDS